VTGGERVTQGRDDACIQNFSPKTWKEVAIWET
jgi:hypothetical protein